LIISLVTMKGGSGKSTAAMCLAGYWHANGLAVALVDSDPAATILRWRETGSDFSDIPAVAAQSDDIAEIVGDFSSQDKDRIVIDTPGFRSPALDEAIRAADLILIPIRPSPIDFQVAADTAELVQEISGADSKRTVRFLLTQCTSSNVITRHMRAEMLEADYALLTGQLSARVIYGEAALAGTTPTFAQPRGAGAREIAELGKEIDTLMGDGGKPKTSARRSRK
jgi:chromosome partitioning protein